MLGTNTVQWTNKDTVEVIVFDPHETDSPVGQDWREGPLLLFVHQKSHEMLNLWHVHISPVISAHQDLWEYSVCEAWMLLNVSNCATLLVMLKTWGLAWIYIVMTLLIKLVVSYQYRQNQLHFHVCVHWLVGSLILNHPSWHKRVWCLCANDIRHFNLETNTFTTLLETFFL